MVKPNKNKATQAREGGGVNKAEFVRSLPLNTSYAEAAAKAKSLGIELTKGYFYVLKSAAKKASAGGVKAKAKRTSKTGIASSLVGKGAREGARKGLRLTSDDAHEQALIEAVRALGAKHARAIIEVVEKFERG